MRIFFTDEFTISGNTLVGEMSALAKGNSNVFSFCFPTMAKGVRIMKRKDGRVIDPHIAVDYVIDAVDRREGEIVGWRLKPTAISVVRVPSAAGTELLIIND